MKYAIPRCTPRPDEKLLHFALIGLLFALGCGSGGDSPAETNDAAVESSAAETGSEASADVTNSDDAGRADVESIDAENVEAGPTDGPAAPIVCNGPGARFITDILSYHFGDGQIFGQDQFPAPILGPPHGAGCCTGSVDVVSIGNGGYVAAAFAGNIIVDGPGPDFLVFENAFDVGNDATKPFAELGSVAVSQDGVNWISFPCTATSYPYGTCAGWHPVFANPDQNDIDPTDPAVAGGDPFDLADVGLTWARYVRVTDVPDDGNVFDLDAMSIVHPGCP